MALRIYPPCFISFLLLVLFLGHVPWLNAGDTDDVPRISADQARQLLGQPDTVVIDVRKSRNWWRSGKMISTAVREDPSKVDQWAPKYSRNQSLVFY